MLHRLSSASKHCAETCMSMRLCRLGPACLALFFVATGSSQAIQAIEAEAATSLGEPSRSVPLSVPRTSPDWWSADVWVDPDRPFLYYGEDEGPDIRPGSIEREERSAQTSEPREAEEPAAQIPALPQNEPKPLESLQTMAEVRAEMDARLDRAVMNPTEANIASYLEANAFVLGKAHVFSDRFQRVRIAKPEFDWTATHPVANHATAELGTTAAADADQFLTQMASEAGLLFIAKGESTLDDLASGPVAALARRYGFEALAVTPSGTPLAGFPTTKPENAWVKGLGLTRRPAVLLVVKPEAKHPALLPLAATGTPLLFGTGPLAVAELKKRLMLLLSPEMSVATDEMLPTRNGRALSTGEAFEKARSSRVSTSSTSLSMPSALASPPSSQTRALSRSQEPHSNADNGNQNLIMSSTEMAVRVDD